MEARSLCHWERAGVRGDGRSMECNPSLGSHRTILRIAEALRPLPMEEVTSSKRAHADSKLVNLAVMDQHPADRGEADDDGGRNRPAADTDVADGLPFGFILRDL